MFVKNLSKHMYFLYSGHKIKEKPLCTLHKFLRFMILILILHHFIVIGLYLYIQESSRFIICRNGCKIIFVF